MIFSLISMNKLINQNWFRMYPKAVQMAVRVQINKPELV